MIKEKDLLEFEVETASLNVDPGQMYVPLKCRLRSENWRGRRKGPGRSDQELSPPKSQSRTVKLLIHFNVTILKFQLNVM